MDVCSEQTDKQTDTSRYVLDPLGYLVAEADKPGTENNSKRRQKDGRLEMWSA